MRKQFGLLAVLCLFAHPASAKGAFEIYGDIAQFAIPLVAAGYSWQQDDDEGLKQFGYALLSTEATVQVLKHTVDATRPDGGLTVFRPVIRRWPSVGPAICRCATVGAMVRQPISQPEL